MSEANSQFVEDSHFLKDWLEVHQIDKESCIRILETAASSFGHVGNYSGSNCRSLCHLTAEQVWALASAALVSWFPFAERLINNVAANSTTSFRGESRGPGQPFTYDYGGERYPFVSSDYNGTVSGVLDIAHEFGHAVQAVANKGVFTSPVIREVCAFLSEIALIDFLRSNDWEMHLQTLETWNEQNNTYLVSGARNLNQVLNSESPRYHYRWNYPIARIASIKGALHFSKDILWLLFENRLSIWHVLSDVGTIADLAETPTSGSAKTLPSLSLGQYRLLGERVHKEIFCDFKRSGRTVARFFDSQMAGRMDAGFFGSRAPLRAKRVGKDRNALETALSLILYPSD